MIFALEYINEQKEVEVVCFNEETDKIYTLTNPVASSEDYEKPDRNEVLFNLVTETKLPDGKFRQDYKIIGHLKSEEFADAYLGIREEIKDNTIRKLFVEMVSAYKKYGLETLS
jgi:hypothetical protein